METRAPEDSSGLPGKKLGGPYVAGGIKKGLTLRRHYPKTGRETEDETISLHQLLRPNLRHIIWLLRSFHLLQNLARQRFGYLI